MKRYILFSLLTGCSIVHAGPVYEHGFTPNQTQDEGKKFFRLIDSESLSYSSVPQENTLFEQVNRILLEIGAKHLEENHQTPTSPLQNGELWGNGF